MKNITKCLNEWNVIIEALGQGKQSIVIRGYPTSLKEFILYPTVSYAKKDYIKSFKERHHDFVEDNTLPVTDGNKFKVKYFAKVENVFNIPFNQLGKLSNFHIWTNAHVNSYLKHQKPFIWILRVYTLQKPIMAERTNGMKFSNLLEEVSLDGINPVLKNSEYAKITSKLKKYHTHQK